MVRRLVHSGRSGLSHSSPLCISVLHLRSWRGRCSSTRQRFNSVSYVRDVNSSKQNKSLSQLMHGSVVVSAKYSSKLKLAERSPSSSEPPSHRAVSNGVLPTTATAVAFKLDCTSTTTQQTNTNKKYLSSVHGKPFATCRRYAPRSTDTDPSVPCTPQTPAARNGTIGCAPSS